MNSAELRKYWFLLKLQNLWSAVTCARTAQKITLFNKREDKSNVGDSKQVAAAAAAAAASDHHIAKMETFKKAPRESEWGSFKKMLAHC